MLALLRRGDNVRRMMQVTGEEGISLDDFVLLQKSVFVDVVYLQQDAFDEVDVSTSPERQYNTFMRIQELVERDYSFADKDAARDFFVRLSGLFKNLNYAAVATPDYNRLQEEIAALIVQFS